MHGILNHLVVLFRSFLGDLACASEELSADSINAKGYRQSDDAETNSNGRFVPRYCTNELVDIPAHKFGLCSISDASLGLFAEIQHRLLKFSANFATSANAANEGNAAFSTQCSQAL
jgi:hypothetical protein